MGQAFIIIVITWVSAKCTYFYLSVHSNDSKDNIGRYLLYI